MMPLRFCSDTNLHSADVCVPSIVEAVVLQATAYEADQVMVGFSRLEPGLERFGGHIGYWI